jgi:hypothetical protein
MTWNLAGCRWFSNQRIIGLLGMPQTCMPGFYEFWVDPGVASLVYHIYHHFIRNALWRLLAGVLSWSLEYLNPVGTISRRRLLSTTASTYSIADTHFISTKIGYSFCRTWSYQTTCITIYIHPWSKLRPSYLQMRWSPQFQFIINKFTINDFYILFFNVCFFFID